MFFCLFNFIAVHVHLRRAYYLYLNGTTSIPTHGEEDRLPVRSLPFSEAHLPHPHPALVALVKKETSWKPITAHTFG